MGHPHTQLLSLLSHSQSEPSLRGWGTGEGPEAEVAQGGQAVRGSTWAHLCPSLSVAGGPEPSGACHLDPIHNGVISVFQRRGLPDQELFSLNEGVRQLLKTELGPFFTEYLQNQLLTQGMVILRDKIRFYEGQKLLDSLAETWDFFFSDVLPTLQAIFYPVQGKEPSVRQLALLLFRNTITLSVKLEDALARAHARVPPAIVQMLLVLQGVHEPRGVTEDYLRLEVLIQKVVSPYLGTCGLFSSEGPSSHSCILEKRLLRSRSGDILAKNPVVRSKSYNTPLLNPVAEHEAEGAAAAGPGIRRHSVSEMTSCPEPQGFAGSPGQGPAGSFRASRRPLGPCAKPPQQRVQPPGTPLPTAGGAALLWAAPSAFNPTSASFLLKAHLRPGQGFETGLGTQSTALGVVAF
uniref:Proline rich 5 n=1 Tax=Marmota marmota marmota TaxID=9994 RepID=A0A8C6A9H0_MARMA